eukprot:CAMPEP_0173088656 /NCGR_PEP_ID=MMETSP1102-20130122/25151_1 /TAXON_ID=49646 /ORGANISM="Geminigera sp., Strain Caron Lab Isolate" /LENGTH=812 /DNA_ID=CAMNT_0013971775 /DNA_START=73 /DNA_END=2511 /DNA_ORIENTATION=+
MSSMNEIQLYRKDLYQVTCVTGKSLGLLPPGESKKKCFRVVVGADNGILTCFRIKKGEAEVEFTSGNLDYPVSRLMIGGPSDKKDRIFFSSAQTIRGLTRKGKEFFRFNTDGAEALKGLHVEDTKIWTTGEYMFNYYIDTKDAGYFMSRDRVNDLLMQPIINAVDQNAILACQDRYVRVLNVNKLHYEAFVQGAVMSLSPLKDASYNDVMTQKKDKGIIFGTDNGLIGELRMDPSSLKPGWLQQNVRGLGAVTSIVAHDLTKNGVDDIIVGRDDGEIQVYGVEDSGAQGMQPQLLLSKSVNECVQDLKVGTVSTTSFDEVLVASYSGRISSFTTEPSTDAGMQAFEAAPSRVLEIALDDAPALPTGSSTEASDSASAGTEKDTKEKKKSSGLKSFFGFKKKEKGEKEEKEKYVGGLLLDRPEVIGDADEAMRSDPKESESKSATLRAEIAALREKVKAEKNNFERLSKENVPVSTRSKIKSSLQLDPESGLHKLTLESEMPMDLVALEGTPGLVLTLLDSGSSVPSISPASAPPKKADGMSEIQVPKPGSEGTYGTLNAFVVTRVAPKVVHLVENEICPLSLHRTVPVDTAANPSKTPYCEIRMAGTFTQSMMHAWVRQCFHDVPSKVPEEDASGMVRYKFESSYTHTTVSCDYSKGDAIFRSANLSTLATLKEVISREATQSKMKIDIKTPIIDEKAVLHVLELLHPKLMTLLKLKESIKYIEAVNELAATPEDKALLSPDLLEVLENGDELKAKHKDNEKHIEFIEQVLEQLFVDRFKFKGINVKHRIAEVKELVDKYSWEGLVSLFAAA